MRIHSVLNEGPDKIMTSPLNKKILVFTVLLNSGEYSILLGVSLSLCLHSGHNLWVRSVNAEHDLNERCMKDLASMVNFCANSSEVSIIRWVRIVVCMEGYNLPPEMVRAKSRDVKVH